MEGKASDWRPGPTVCRCCLSEGCYKDISTEYFWMGKREVYEEMLTETLNISISFSKSGGPNSNSRLICEPCIARLRDATEFKRQVIDCEKTFMHHLDPGSSSSRVTVQTIGDVKVELVKREKDTSDDDFDDRPDFLDVDSDDDLDNQPLTKLASKVPKKEAVDILDLLDNSQITVKRKATLKIKEAPPKKLKKKEVVVKPSASKPAPAKKPTEKKKGQEKGTTNDSPEVGPKITWKRKRKLPDHKVNAALIVEHSNAVVFRCQRGKFMCAYCPKFCSNLNELRYHSSEHNKLKIFESKSVRHTFPLKIDISELVCSICNLSMDGIEHLKSHLTEVHAIPINPRQTDGVIPFNLTGLEFRCVLCNVRFENYMTLFVHMNKHYQSFVCDSCGKGFSGENKLRSHIRNHESGQFGCTQCDLSFTSRVSKNRHMTETHGPKDRYRCPICDEHISSYHSRLRHLSTVHGEKFEYRCTYCPAVFISGTLKYSHIQSVHFKKRRKTKYINLSGDTSKIK